MPILKYYLHLTTSVIALGITILSVNSAQAAMWSRTLTPNNDTYSDSQDGKEDKNFGAEHFIRVGHDTTGTLSSNGPVLNPPEQRGYLSWDLQKIIDDIQSNPNMTDGVQIRNVDATLILHHSSIDPDNPDPLNSNDPNRLRPGFPRVLLDGLGVTGSWNEEDGIDLNSPPNTIDAPTLFSGQIDIGDELGRNFYRGNQFNTFIEDILNSNFNEEDDENILSIALKPTSSFNFPIFGLSPMDSFISQNHPNEDFQPQLELEFEVWNKAYNVIGGPKTTLQARLGDRNTWEWAQSTKHGNGHDKVWSNTNWTWQNGQEVEFELLCNPNNNELSLTVGNKSPISYQTNTCEGIDGVSMFAQARTDDTIMQITLDTVKELGGEFVNMSDRNFDALGVAGEPLESVQFYFTDKSDPFDDDPNKFGGGLDINNGVHVIRGSVTMEWDEEKGKPKGSDNANQIQLTALTRLDDPLADFLPQGFLPQGFLPQNSDPQTQVFETDCINGTPNDEVWSLTASSNPERLPEYTCSSNEISANNTTVPEPTSIISLMLLGTTGLGLRLRRK